MTHLHDYDIQNVFPVDLGIGMMCTKQNREYQSIWEGPMPRKILLDITSWRGKTLGATHYYGSFKIASLKLRELDSNKIVYPFLEAPEETKGYEICLTRKLTRRDILMDRGERFRGFKIGDRVKNFDTKDELLAYAIEFFKEYFGKDWSLITYLARPKGGICSDSVELTECVIC